MGKLVFIVLIVIISVSSLSLIKYSQESCRKCKVILNSGEILYFKYSCPTESIHYPLTHIYGYPLSNIKRFQTIKVKDENE